MRWPTLFIIVLIVSLTGCSTLSNMAQGEAETTVTQPDGKVWKAVAKADSLVEIRTTVTVTEGETVTVTRTTFKVDNRGTASPIAESLTAMALMGVGRTNVNVGEK